MKTRFAHCTKWFAFFTFHCSLSSLLQSPSPSFMACYDMMMMLDDDNENDSSVKTWTMRLMISCFWSFVAAISWCAMIFTESTWKKNFEISLEKKETLRSASVAPGKIQDLPLLTRVPSVVREKSGVEQERCKKWHNYYRDTKGNWKNYAIRHLCPEVVFFHLIKIHPISFSNMSTTPINPQISTFRNLEHYALPILI